jgi:hypothetical protein
MVPFLRFIGILRIEIHYPETQGGLQFWNSWDGPPEMGCDLIDIKVTSIVSKR